MQYQMKQPLKVAAICGSLRKGSYTRAALQIALQGAAEFGAEIQLIELCNYNLTFMGMVDEQDSPDDVLRLQREVSQAQGVILGTPEYHGSLSGVLKNALDFLSARELEGKMLGLIGIAGGQLGATNALNSLRTIGRNLHAWVLPQQVSIPEAHKIFDKSGNIGDRNIERRLLEVGRLTAKFAAVHLIQKDLEFVTNGEGQLFITREESPLKRLSA